MAIVDVYLSQDGVASANGLSYANRVPTLQRANSVMSGIGGGNTARLHIGRFDLVATAGSLNGTNMNRETAGVRRGLGNYVDNGRTAGDVLETVTVPDGVEIVPYDANQNVHISGLRVIGAAVSDWTPMFWDAAARTFTDVATGNLSTNIWRTSADIINISVANTVAKTYRMWRGGLANGMSALDYKNEIFESRSLMDLGTAKDRLWTQRGYPDVLLAAEREWTPSAASSTVIASNVGGSLALTIPANTRLWGSFQLVTFTTNGTLPGGLASATTYWLCPVIGSVASRDYRVAATRENALAGVFIPWSSGGSGVHTMQSDNSVGLVGRRMYVHCVGNPASVWGGVTIHTREAQYFGLYLKCMRGVTVSPDLKFLGGIAGNMAAIDNCEDVLYEARHDATSILDNTVGLVTNNTYGALTENRRITIAPAYDSTSGDDWPGWVNVGEHSYGSSDMLQFTNLAVVKDITVKEKASNGRQSYFINPRHTAIGNSGTFGETRRLIVEPGVIFRGGAHEYQRAFGLNGVASNFTDWIIGGQVSGMSAPDQIGGSGVMRGLVKWNNRPMYPSAVDGSNLITDRWGFTRTWNFAYDATIAKYMNASMTFPQYAGTDTGNVLVIECDFECWGIALQWALPAILSPTPRLTVTKTVFRRGPLAVPAFKDVINIGTSGNPGQYINFVDNVVIGDGIKGQVGTPISFTRYELPDMAAGGVLGANGFAINTGWQYYPTQDAYDEELARAKVA